MFFLLFLKCFCLDESYEDNLTEICINPLQGDCKGIFEVKTPSDFEKYCVHTENLTLYLINDFITTAFFNMLTLYELRECTIIGLSNYSSIYVAIDPKKSQQIDLKAENVAIELSSHSSAELTFNSLSLHETTINSYVSEICAKYIDSDPYSLSGPQKFYSQIFNIDNSHLPKNSISLSLNLYTRILDLNELKVNLFGIANDYSIFFESTTAVMSFEQFGVSISFNVNAPKVSFSMSHESTTNNITLSMSDSQDINNWACGIYQISMIHTGQLLINLITSNFFFNQLSVNQLNFTSTRNCLCKILHFKPTNTNQSIIVNIDANTSINLYNDCDASVAFLGQGVVNIASDFNIDHFKKLYFQNLSFSSNYASIKIDVTRNKKEALIMVKENFNFLNDIVIYPVYDKTRFTVPDDIDSLLGQALLTFCASNADIESFDVRAQQYSDTYYVPPGFTSEALSFSLQQNQNCISLIFAKDPRSFSTDACIYNTNSNLCENITDSIYDASKGESPFNDDISAQYINIKIAEDLPKNYFLNLSKLAGNHEIRISSLPSESEVNSLSENSIPASNFEKINSLPIREINIVDIRSDTTETSLIFEDINVHFYANVTEYEKIYLTSGSKIINNVNLSYLNSLELDFNYLSSYDQVLYGCENIRMHHVSVDEIIYEQDNYIFIKKDMRMSFSNNHTYTLLFDSTTASPIKVELNIKTDDIIKPLIFRSNTAGPLFFNFTNLNGQTPPTLTAIQLQIDSSSDIYFTSPTSNIPVEIISLRDSSTFEKMKRITVYSESSVDRGFYPTSFTIHEDNVSFIAFSPYSSRPIPSFFSEIDVSSDTYIISESYEKGKHDFGNISFIANDLKIDYGVKATLIYGMILKSITIYENSKLNLFHVSIRNSISLKYYVTLGQKPSIINLIENQSMFDIPSKTPFYIKDDTGTFLPETINIEHKVPHRKNQEKLFLDADNDTTQYCILMLKQTDRCDPLASAVKFDPSEISFPEGVYTFKAICLPQCLGVAYEFHKNENTPTSGIFDTKNIIIIASLSGVLLIAIIIIVVLVVKRKQNPNDYMKSLLMTLPSDM